MDYRLISIGTLAAHPLWGEKAPVRTGHATCTLIRSGRRVVIVDPGLPESAMVARLRERTGLGPEAVTHVFLTRFTRDTCRGVTAFPNATWLISQDEREGMGVPLVGDLTKAASIGDEEVKAALELDVAILKRCEPAPDRIADGVSLFPLHGVSPGLTGLLLEGFTDVAGGAADAPTSGGRGKGAGRGGKGGRGGATVLVCGDAIPTVEHLAQGAVLQGLNMAADYQKARESFAEAVEIADVLVLGRDNAVVNPLQRPF